MSLKSPWELPASEQPDQRLRARTGVVSAPLDLPDAAVAFDALELGRSEHLLAGRDPSAHRPQSAHGLPWRDIAVHHTGLGPAGADAASPARSRTPGDARISLGY